MRVFEWGGYNLFKIATFVLELKRKLVNIVYQTSYFKQKTNPMRPLILVTNDDGVTSKGIRALIEVASTFGEVVVVAPDRPQSGKGHAITLDDPIRIHPVDIFEGIEDFCWLIFFFFVIKNF